MFGLKKVSEEIVEVNGKVKKIITYQKEICLTSQKEAETARLAKIESEIASV